MHHPFALYLAVSWTDDDIQYLKDRRKVWARDEQQSFVDEKSRIDELMIEFAPADDTTPEQTEFLIDARTELIRDEKKYHKGFRKLCQRWVKVYTLCIKYMEGGESDFAAELHGDIRLAFSQALDQW